VDPPTEALTRVVPYDPADGVLRRCSRCLQFLLDDGSSVARPTWWLCLPCHAVLLPRSPRGIGRREALPSVTAGVGTGDANDSGRS
jgi:hypothetical protein